MSPIALKLEVPHLRYFWRLAWTLAILFHLLLFYLVRGLLPDSRRLASPVAAPLILHLQTSAPAVSQAVLSGQPSAPKRARDNKNGESAATDLPTARREVPPTPNLRQQPATISAVAEAKPQPQPGLDMEVLRQGVRHLPEDGVEKPFVSRKRVPWQASSPESAPSELARKLSQAEKPDCRSAYTGVGLLAAPKLLYDAVSDSGCRW